MNKQIVARIAALEKLAARAAAERARYAPYSEVRVRPIIGNRADVVYHLRGNYGASEKTDGLTISEAFDCAAERGAPVFVHMVFSPEWVHSFYQTSDLYTPEQKAQFKEKDLAQWPDEIGWIYSQNHPDAIISTLAKCPQVFELKV